jgi:hypothetical protein
LKRDLLAADDAGVTWKFVLVPEPIQNLGPLLGADRFEGYAAERTELLRFIHEASIDNVVFISADIHCTIINDLSYQLHAGGAQVHTSMWEVSTGPVAYAAPFGPTVVTAAQSIPGAGSLLALPYRLADRRGKDALLRIGLNVLITSWGYGRIGLDDSDIRFRRERGDWVSLHTYGWTEFEIEAHSQRLTVTTYGFAWYDADALADDPVGVIERRPQVISRHSLLPENRPND